MSAFFAQLNVSERTLSNYKNALKSRFIKEILLKDYKAESLFEIDDLELLWKIYSKINLHPNNVNKHRLYSAPIMKYIRFLNKGEKYGRRIDYRKPKPKKQTN